jgi:hypothetical protein
VNRHGAGAPMSGELSPRSSVDRKTAGGVDEGRVPRDSEEREETAPCKMLPPRNGSLKQLALDQGISDATLSIWRRRARRGRFPNSRSARLMGEEDQVSRCRLMASLRVVNVRPDPRIRPARPSLIACSFTVST